MSKIPKTKQLLNLPITDVNKMTAAELRAAVQVLSSAANKRLARLGSTEIGQLSPAYTSAMKRSYTGVKGGKFGTSSKNRNQLLNEFKAVKGFLELKTSTVTSWQNVRKRSYERAGIPLVNDAQKEREFWSIYRKLTDLSSNLSSMAYGSEQAQTDLRRIMYGEKYKNILTDINTYNTKNLSYVQDENGNTIPINDFQKIAQNNDVIVTENGILHHINTSDPDDILKIMELKVDVEYEREQYSMGEDEFFEL